MSGTQTSTSARVLRPGWRWRWSGLSLRTKLQHRKDRTLAVEIERLERLGEFRRHSEARDRVVMERQRWL